MSDGVAIILTVFGAAIVALLLVNYDQDILIGALEHRIAALEQRK